MSLVTGRGPLSKDPAGWFSPPLPDDVVFVEPHPRRVQAMRDGTALIDTERALLVHRAGRPLCFAFPSDEVGELPHDPVAEAPGYVQVPLGCGGHVGRRGPQTRPLPAEPVFADVVAELPQV